MINNFVSLKVPSKHFNLLFLEDKESHISKLQVHLCILSQNELSKGYLHLCSQGLFFEPQALDLPLIRLKFSANFDFKYHQNADLQPKDSQNELEDDLDLLDERPSRSSKQKVDPEVLALLNYMRKNSAESILYYLCDMLVVDVNNYDLIPRNPREASQIQKNKENFVFFVPDHEENRKINDFVKHLGGLSTATGEVDLVEEIVQTRVKNQYREWDIKYDKKFVHFRHITKRITPEGTQTGLFFITNDGFLNFKPLVNNPKCKELKIKLTHIKCILKYRHLFHNNALQVWKFHGKRCKLLVFDDEKTRDAIFNFLYEKLPYIRNYIERLDVMTEKWVKGQVNNFDYLMYLNTVASRSVNDLAQYPIFPWVIGDYTSSKLDLNNPKSFRDLRKPVGALNPSKLKKFKSRYEDMQNESGHELPFMYGSHYSTPAIILYFLIRQIPDFTLKLQNGAFGPGDRIFRSIEQGWWSCLNIGPDVKELIPEFYDNNGDFLLNTDEIDLGITQDNELIDDVVLPAWASTSQEFCQKMRMALESDYVSSELHHWIDLIFGYKQSGPASVEAHNVFYNITYEENIDWSQIPKEDRPGLELQIQEFGQCPQQLFQQPHPRRQSRGMLLNNPVKECFFPDERQVVMKKIMISSQEVERLKTELDNVNKMHRENLARQNNEFKIHDKRRKKQIDRLKKQHQDELEGLKTKLEKLERESGGNDGKENQEANAEKEEEYKTAIEELKENHKKELAKYVNRYTTISYVKGLENAISKFKKKEGQLVANIEKLQKRISKLETTGKRNHSTLYGLQKKVQSTDGRSRQTRDTGSPRYASGSSKSPRRQDYGQV